MVNIRKNIATNITKHRKLMKLSQKELAEAIGVKSFTTVSSWERGGNIPDVETLFKLCIFFNISVDEMYGVEQFAKSVQAFETTISYCKKLGYTVDERIIKWHWDNEADLSKRIQVIDEAEFTLMKDGYSANFTQVEFEGLEIGAKEAIEGRFYKKVLAQEYNTKRLQKEVEQIELTETIKKRYGDSAKNALSFYLQLDFEDQAEIRGEMKQMLKQDKYNIQKES